MIPSNEAIYFISGWVVGMLHMAAIALYIKHHRQTWPPII